MLPHRIIFFFYFNRKNVKITAAWLKYKQTAFELWLLPEQVKATKHNRAMGDYLMMRNEREEKPAEVEEERRWIIFKHPLFLTLQIWFTAASYRQLQVIRELADQKGIILHRRLLSTWKHRQVSLKCVYTAWLIWETVAWAHPTLVSLLYETCRGVQQWPQDGAAARKYSTITQRDEKANERGSVLVPQQSFVHGKELSVYVFFMVLPLARCKLHLCADCQSAGGKQSSVRIKTVIVTNMSFTCAGWENFTSQWGKKKNEGRIWHRSELYSKWFKFSLERPADSITEFAFTHVPCVFGGSLEGCTPDFSLASVGT